MLCNTSNVDTYCGTPTEEQMQITRAAYIGSVEFVDEWIGKVLTALAQNGLNESTFVMFIADHGDALGDHHLFRKGYYTEQVASIPFMMTWPKSFDSMITVARGSMMEYVVELRDVLPTLAHVAGITLTDVQKENLQGDSILSLMIGDQSHQGSNWRQWIDLEMALCDMSWEMNYNALTDGKMKYVHSLYDGSERLFNLTEDAREMADLANVPVFHDVLELWRARLENQFILEGRGEMFILKDGSLAFNRTNMTCTQTKIMDNYPCYPNVCGL